MEYDEFINRMFVEKIEGADENSRYGDFEKFYNQIFEELEDEEKLFEYFTRLFEKPEILFNYDYFRVEYAFWNFAFEIGCLGSFYREESVMPLKSFIRSQEILFTQYYARFQFESKEIGAGSKTCFIWFDLFCYHWTTFPELSEDEEINQMRREFLNVCTNLLECQNRYVQVAALQGINHIHLPVNIDKKKIFLEKIKDDAELIEYAANCFEFKEQ